MSDFISEHFAVLIGIAVAVLLVRRWRGEPLQAQELFLPPLFLAGFGIYKLATTNEIDWTAIDVTWLVIGSLVGAAFGAIRGMTITVFKKEGVLWYRYTAKTFGILVLSFAVSLLIAYLSNMAGVQEEAHSTMLSIGVGFLGEAAIVGYKAFKLGVPFAPPKDRR